MNDKVQPSQSLQTWMKFFVHFLFLSIVFILPEILMSRDVPEGVGTWRIYVKSVIFVAIFYINYYFIIDYCLGKKNWVLRLILLNVAVAVVAVVVMVVVHLEPERHHSGRRFSNVHHLTFILRDMGMCALTIALSVAMKLSDYWDSLRARHKEMQAEQHREELNSLKSQLNPHFLFNTLNSIYALIAISPEKAQSAVHELSRLLRYVLYENAPTVRLSEELDFIDNYVKLMKLRLADPSALSVTLDSGDSGNCRIAPLLFISPVENAFKHGNFGVPGGKIEISIIASGGMVDCHISNTFDTGKSAPESGIGKANLHRRLDLIYGNKAELDTEIADGMYNVNLKIQL